MSYQQNFPPIYPTQPIPPFMAAPMSPGIETSLKELCQKLTNVEKKLEKLDRIEDRLNTMDKKFKSVDQEVNSCKERLTTLEQSAQFLSDVQDEHKALKKRLETVAGDIESTKNFSNKLLDIETQSLEYNLLFFAIDEDPLVEPDTEENGQENQAAEGGQTTEKENCQEKIYEFLEIIWNSKM